ncbi:MAG: hypothetical protein MJA83_10075, partial [Gammaproteobacteria bacterium]|nr:hypothetical protein [Gammaproteobacteria bacterium]
DTGLPQRISGHSIQLGRDVNEDNIERLTRNALRQIRGVLQIDIAQLQFNKADFQAPRNPGASAGTWYVYYHQVYRGVPVHGGAVTLVVRDTEITSFGINVFPDINIAASPDYAREQAIQKLTRLHRESAPLESELVVYSKRRDGSLQYFLAWDVLMPAEKAPFAIAYPGLRETESQQDPRELVRVQWRYFIDARNGNIIQRINTMRAEDVTGTVTGMILPEFPSDTPVASPIANMTVQVTQGATTVEAQTDDSGNYTATGLAAGTADLQARLVGPNIIVRNEETADPDATHAATVSAPGTHDWNWTSDDPSPSDAETNAFYHVNLIREWFLRGGEFDVDPLPNPMPVAVRDGPYCNASAGSDGLFFGSGRPGRCEDLSLCSDIVYHEYTHRIVEKVYGDAGVPTYFGIMIGAMHEAWADYYGATLTGAPVNGEGCDIARDFGTDYRFPDDWIGDFHNSGRILSGALWDLRGDLGAAYVDALGLRAMKQATLNFSDYLGAVLAEDDDPAFSTDPAGANNNPADGTPNIDAICHNYYDLHGILHEFCAGHTQTPVAALTEPSPIKFNIVGSDTISMNIVGTAWGSEIDPLANYQLDYAPESDITSWVTAGISLSGGGLAEVTNGSLGQLDVTGLADGFYVLRLTVNTTGGASVVATADFIIDKALMAGWPVAPDTHFYSTPAVADFDPSYPGLEVAMMGDDFEIQVRHADGTMVPGWPQHVGFTGSTPAVADIDNDGLLELV